MKILYIANERSAARLAERVLPDFKVLWASNFERVGFWILEYPDVAALIAEVQSDSAGCAYLKRARRLGLKAPVVIVLPDGAGSPVESLEAGVDSYIAKDQAFSRELPVVVARAIERAQTSPVARRDHLPSGAVRESAAGVAASRQSQGSVSTVQQPLNATALVHRSLQSTVGVHDDSVSAIASKSMLERRISELESLFHQREQSWAAEQAAAAARQETLEKFLHHERSMRTGFEQKLADAKAALEDAEHRHSAAITAASDALAKRHTQYEVGMTRVASTWDTVDEQLRQWALEVERARQSLASSAVTEVESLRRHKAELTSQLAEATAARRSLEGQLADAESALRTANERASHDCRVAAEQAVERQAELEGLIQQERAARADLEQQLAQLEAARREAERQHASAITTALTERQVQFEVELSQTVATRDDFKRQVQAAETAVLAARHDHAAAVTEVECLTRHEAELTSQLAEATATRRSLEARLADAESALRTANERASYDCRVAAEQAVERQAELEGLIQQERAARADVEQQLAQLEAARREAERQHASAMTTALTERQVQFEVELSQTVATRDDFKRQVQAAETAVLAARHDHAAAVTEVARLTRHEAELTSQLAEATATRRSLEGRLADAESALRTANERASHDRRVAAEQAAERQAGFQAQLEREVEKRRSLEDDLAGARTARDGAEKLHQSAVAAAAALRTEFDAEWARAAQARGDLEAALNEARQTLTSNAATVERLTARETELEGLIHQERAGRADVEQQLAQVEAARREAERQHASAMTTAATTLAERQAQFEVELSQTTAARDDFKRQLNAAETALLAARHDRAAAATDVERLARHADELTSQLAEATATRSSLEDDLARTRVARDGAEKLHQSAVAAAAALRTEFDAEWARAAEARGDLEAALNEARQTLTSNAATVERLTARETELEGLIHQERAARADVEQQLAQVEAARREDERQHASVMTAALAEFEVVLSQTVAARDDFKRQLNVAETALAEARHDHAATATEVERLARHEAELTSQLAEAAATRRGLEEQLADAATAMKEATSRQADVESRLAREITNREALERGIAEVRSVAADAEQRFRDETATLTARAGAEVARLEAQIAQEREDHKDRLTELLNEIGNLEAARGALDQSLVSIRDQSRQREIEHQEERDGLERALQVAEAEGLRLVAERRQAQHHFEEARTGFQQTLERVSSEHADALAKLTAAVAEGDARIKEQAAQHASSLHAAERDRSQLQNDFQTTLIAREGEIERLQGSLNMTIQELTGARRRCEILQTEADRVTQLERQLEESRVEIRRQFHQCAFALWRCTADGALTHANRALWDLVGCRKPDELHGADFAKTVFESPNDLAWLIGRCSSTNARQSVETAWKRRDGTRFVVRLSAVESAPDVIEIAVEDITNLRGLEHKLDQSHRMEAVGRVASEVAVTCGKLLRDAYDDGQQFLTEVSGDPPLRKRGEMLLEEVARAAGYLQRLDAYGEEQANALEPVDLNVVLRDLKPVLKNVAGDDVELEVSKISSPLNVDMKADHVERLLVNLAGYGRERMPFGGQLRIELATVVVDQEFIAHYPNVRQGPHALITVTEARRAMLAEGPLQLRDGAAGSTADGVATDTPGVDLGALQELIQECGGHLWMTVEPPGNMVVEIRLPLRVWDDAVQQTMSGTPSSRGGVMARWFRH
jgi:chromosome segregation ATPase